MLDTAAVNSILFNALTRFLIWDTTMACVLIGDIGCYLLDLVTLF